MICLLAVTLPDLKGLWVVDLVIPDSPKIQPLCQLTRNSARDKETEEVRALGTEAAIERSHIALYLPASGIQRGGRSRILVQLQLP